MKLIKWLFAPYAVIARWDGLHLHLAWSRDEALAWMACYPKTMVVIVKQGMFSNKVVAERY